jgi:hypothetical protein
VKAVLFPWEKKNIIRMTGCKSLWTYIKRLKVTRKSKGEIGMKKVRKVCSKLLTLILAYIIICSVPVRAGENDWMTSAKEVRFNTITRGTARNNMNPTLMDPWRSFGENFYFSVPVKMNITIILSIQGNQSVYLGLNNNQGNYLCSSDTGTYNRAKNQSSFIIQRVCEPGEYYIRLSKIFKSDSEQYPYAIKVQAKLANSVNIKSVRRVTTSKVRITWNNVGNATAYEIFRNYSARGTFKKVATVNGKITSFSDSRLKRGRSYYYIVRAYKIVNGVKMYSNASGARGIRM